MTLPEHLSDLGVDASLSSILLDIALVNERIYDSIDLREMEKGGAENASGDTQSSLDVTAEQKIVDVLETNEHVCSYLSEEHAEFRTCSATGTYFVSYDPYDGGSIGDANITASSIFGIWDTPPTLGQPAGTNLRAGAYALWGPKLLFAWGTKEHGVFWYERSAGIFEYRDRLTFDAAGKHKKIFCPGDLALLLKDDAYRALVEHMLIHKASVRYAGSCGTDTHHVLLHGGCFWYPKSEKRPNGHLRLMYECAPLGFLVTAAGGIAVSHEGRSVLDVPIRDWHQRVPIFLSSPGYTEASELFAKVGPSQTP